jgi:hypothetical protein
MGSYPQTRVLLGVFAALTLVACYACVGDDLRAWLFVSLERHHFGSCPPAELNRTTNLALQARL